MATGNIISICNRSLLSIGSQSQISNLNEGSTQADACATLFTPTFEALARAAYWNCLRAQVTLSLIAAAQGTPENQEGASLPLPPSPWLYAYQYPSDCLAARFVLPSLPNNAPGVPISPAYLGGITSFSGREYPFRVGYITDTSGNPLIVVLTNQPQAQLVYTVNQPNPQIWDSSFQAAMVASLAAYLVPALSLNMTLAQMQIRIADTIITQARVRDGDEGSQSQDHIPDFIKARNAGAIIGPGYGYSGGWSEMAWGI